MQGDQPLVLFGPDDGDVSLFHQAEVLIPLDAPFPNVAGDPCPGLTQVTGGDQSIAAVVPRPDEDQHPALVEVHLPTDLGHRPTGVLHHCCIGMAAFISSSFDAAHFLHSYDFHHPVPPIIRS